MAHEVIISYSSHDKLQADAICNRLEAQGIRCWIAPRDVPAGTEYADSIVQAIEKAEVLVLVYSSHADESTQVRREVERAVNEGTKIMPVRIEDAEMSKSFEYYVGSIHWLDAITPPLEKHIDKLAHDLKALLANSGPRPAVAPPVATATPDAELGVAPTHSEPTQSTPPPTRRETQAPEVTAQDGKGRRPLILGGAAVLLAAVVGGYMVLSPDSVVVPAVEGRMEPEARQSLEDLNLEVVVRQVESDQPGGRAIRTEPAAGEQAERNGQVTLFISGMVTIPRLQGLQLEGARDTLQQLSLPVSSQVASQSLAVEVEYEPSQEDAGLVLRSEPSAGARVLLGDNVILYVSEDKVTVPDVLGTPESEAEAAITAAALRAEIVRDWQPGSELGTVFRTDPASATDVSRDSPVTLFVAGRGGWVYLDNDRLVADQIVPMTTGRNLRDAPNTDSTVLGQVNAGTSVRVLGPPVAGWVRVVIN